MILRWSAVVARHRRWVPLAMLVVGAGAVVDAVRAPTEPSGALVVAGAVAALALVAGAMVATAVRWQAADRFEVDEAQRAFRTPRSATPVFLVVFLVAAVALLGEVGGWSWAHGDRDGGWIVAMVLTGVPALLLSAAVWRGHGITLTPDGIHADHGTGTVTIPWTALSAAQPRPATPPTDYLLDLVLAHPDQVTGTGLVLRRNRLTFEGTRPAFVTAVIRHYAADPAGRPAIGTQTGHRRLVELLTMPSPAPGPPPSRRHIAVLVAVGVLMFGVAVATATWADAAFGGDSVPGYAADAVRSLLGLLSVHVLADAVRGGRARRAARGADPGRPGSAPPETGPPETGPPETDARPASRPSWARDVTGGD